MTVPARGHARRFGQVTNFSRDWATVKINLCFPATSISTASKTSVAIGSCSRVDRRVHNHVGPTLRALLHTAHDAIGLA